MASPSSVLQWRNWRHSDCSPSCSRATVRRRRWRWEGVAGWWQLQPDMNMSEGREECAVCELLGSLNCLSLPACLLLAPTLLLSLSLSHTRCLSLSLNLAFDFYFRQWTRRHLYCSCKCTLHATRSSWHISVAYFLEHIEKKKLPKLPEKVERIPNMIEYERARKTGR